jgi:hypothetical protein
LLNRISISELFFIRDLVGDVFLNNPYSQIIATSCLAYKF